MPGVSSQSFSLLSVSDYSQMSVHVNEANFALRVRCRFAQACMANVPVEYLIAEGRSTDGCWMEILAKTTIDESH